MISRVADHCFWVGRYFDRAESTSRLLQVTRVLAFDAELPALECWRPVVIVSGQYPDFVARFDTDAAGNGEVVQRYMTWAQENPVSIRTAIRAARESARSIREVLSTDIWQATNELYLWFASEEAAQQYLHDRDEVYQHVRRSTQLNLGLVRSTMLHDSPMDFLWLGVLLERVGQTARILDMHHHMLEGAGAQHQILETALWLSLLRSCSGFDAFMRLHRGRVSRSEVVAFLFFEPRFPRSLRYCVQSALKIMERIWSESDSTDAAHAIETMTALDVWLGEKSLAPLPRSIHELLTHVVDAISSVCGAVQQNISGDRTTPATAAAAPKPAAATQSQSQS
jgi:uncharacterized alpha-E superfamily protein